VAVKSDDSKVAGRERSNSAYNTSMATTVRTTCTMDCPDSCALEVLVARDRIIRIQAASPETTPHPNTQGFICDKVQKFDRRVYHESRILYPMRRTGAKGAGEFRRISWEQALAEIAAKFREIIAQWGGEAILPYHYDGSNGLLSHEFLDNYLFAKLGASRLERTLCAAPATAVATGMYGKMPGVAFQDYVHARAIIVWGANPKASNIHLAPYLREARKKGAFLAAVDPIRNFNSHDIDLHLPVYPGADLPVALAMIREWKEEGRLDRPFLAAHADGLETLLAAADPWTIERAAEVARIPAQDIRTLARVYAEASPALIRLGWGTERNQNGGQALAAVLAMPALLGKFGVRGGGYTLSNSGAAKLDMARIFNGNAAPWTTRSINMSQLGGVLTNGWQPPVKALFVYDCNPAATAPDQNAVLRGLAREDLFTVVHEQVMTDTALYADIVLPAVTFLEQQEIKRSYGSYIVGGVQPVIPPEGEAKPNEWVFAQLGKALGYTDEPFTWDTATCVRQVAAALSLDGRPCDPSAIAGGGIQRYSFPGGGPVQLVSARPQTPDGKIHLAPNDLGPAPYAFQAVEEGRYPLALVSSSNNKMISSTLGEFNYPELFITMHPADAAARGAAEGDLVRVFNDLGEVICRLRRSDRVRPGVAMMPKGAWRKSSRNGQTVTALCPAHVNVVAGGACFNDARVEVQRI
jgi:anaerobic selenocysteine-containing dehydrogenase